MTQPLRLLLIEDSDDDSALIQDALRRDYALSAVRVETEQELRAALAGGEWDLILSDYSLPGFSAQGALATVSQSGVDTPVIVVSGTVGEEIAVETLKLGAQDYLLKQNLTRLLPAVTRVLEMARGRSRRRQMEQALRQEHAYSGAILNSLPGAFYHCDAHLRLVRWNHNLEQISGYSATELASIDLTELFAVEDRGRVRDSFREAFSKGEFQLEADVLHKDRRRLPYLLTGVRFEHGGKQGFMGTGTDIGERRRMEDALREETARFEAQVESSPAGILVVDREGNRVLQNQRLSDMWKLPPDVTEGSDMSRQIKLAHGRMKHPQLFINQLAAVEAHPDQVFRDEIELTDGTVLEHYSAPVLDREGRNYGRTWIHTDITERRQTERRMQHLATYDALTDLPNRNLIQERIAHQIILAREHGRPFALLFLDLDRFKIINDGYGHGFGDAVLRAMGRRLLSLVDSTATVARLGGDEFLLLLPNLNSAGDAYSVARQVVACLDSPLLIDDRELHVSGSMGVSVFPQDGDNAEDLIGNADIAMYRAKNLGRNTCQFFSREMSVETQQRIDLETGLRGAVAAGQLHLVYQPKVNLATGRIISCEALVRWQHPELGPVSPSEFIPIAEDCGLIVPISDWVLRTACQQSQAWLDAGLSPARVAVNLSARQFMQQDVASWVMQTLQETGLPPDMLELELTESLIAQDIDKTASTLGQLRALGVKLSIDDFGTGHSSLSYLKRFRVDTLKIDQSFIRSMMAEQENGTIVLAVIALAHKLSFKVLAEGVETQEQYRFLRDNHCDEIQGYYFSRPVPADEFAAMLRTDRRLLE